MKNISIKRQTPQFTPTREEVQDTVEEYLKRGGKITQINPEDFEAPESPNSPWDVDTFLQGKDYFSTPRHYWTSIIRNLCQSIMI